VYVPVAGVYGERAVPYDETLDRGLMKRAGDYLEGVVTRLTSVANIRASSALLEGSVADAISRHAATVAADLLVMTTQGRGPLARFWLGSVSDQLVRQAGIPILFVPPHAAAATDLADKLAFQRVLIPLDGSTLAERVLEPALSLGAGSPPQYTLLRVVEPTTELSYGPAGGAITGFGEALKTLQELDQAQSKHAYKYLDDLACSLRARSFTVNTRVILNDRPATAILDDASVHAIDLIALATHGRSGVKRLVLGSVADKVLRGADTPVLMFRPVHDSAPTTGGSIPGAIT
jgi:nucleotide-binding universal stress UspA family protein